MPRSADAGVVATRVLRALGPSRLVDSLDKLVARYRKLLGRFVPEGPAPRRDV